MEISPYLLSLLLLYSFLFGGAVGILNDLHRLTRIFFGVRYSKKRFARLYDMRIPLVGRRLGEIGAGRVKRTLLPMMIFLQDVILFVFSAVGISILLYYFNYGRFRLFSVFATLLGFVAYYFTAGKLVMLFSEGIICLLRMTGMLFFYLATRPFIFLWRWIRAVTLKFLGKIREAIAKRRKRLYNIRMISRLMKEAEFGFLTGADMTEDLRKIRKEKGEEGHGAEELL